MMANKSNTSKGGKMARLMGLVLLSVSPLGYFGSAPAEAGPVDEIVTGPSIEWHSPHPVYGGHKSIGEAFSAVRQAVDAEFEKATTPSYRIWSEWGGFGNSVDDPKRCRAQASMVNGIATAQCQYVKGWEQRDGDPPVMLWDGSYMVGMKTYCPLGFEPRHILDSSSPYWKSTLVCVAPGKAQCGDCDPLSNVGNPINLPMRVKNQTESDYASSGSGLAKLNYSRYYRSDRRRFEGGFGSGLNDLSTVGSISGGNACLYSAAVSTVPSGEPLFGHCFPYVRNPDHPPHLKLLGKGGTNKCSWVPTFSLLRSRSLLGLSSDRAADLPSI